MAFNLIPLLIPEPALHVVEDYRTDYNYAKAFWKTFPSGNHSRNVLCKQRNGSEGIVFPKAWKRELYLRKDTQPIKLTVSNGPKLITISNYKNTQAEGNGIEELRLNVVVEEEHSNVPPDT